GAMIESSTTIQVISAGLPRTGTKSLKNALEIIYHKPCYHMFEIIFNKQSDIIKWQNLIHDSHMITTPPPLTTKTIAIYDKLKELLDGYIATTDLPTCGFYKDLMNIYPNAKVLLTIRDKYDWLHSLRKVVLPKSNDPWKLKIEEGDKVLGLNSDFYKLSEDSLKFAFQKDDLNFDDDQVLLECYDEYNRLVQETVPSDRLLVLRLGDGWEPLCKFLNVEIPNGIDYPCVNSHHQMTQLTEQLIKYKSLDAIIHMFPDLI
uniref:Sulfotransferase oxamniquine resistance protein n=1 Tax=Schistosoma mansoni TaxID=6183 RepID=UPI000EA7F180|nr:Chain A, Sulfotransferase oxamniquine resistance protein [Schistosoma mansoni]